MTGVDCARFRGSRDVERPWLHGIVNNEPHGRISDSKSLVVSGLPKDSPFRLRFALDWSLPHQDL